MRETASGRRQAPLNVTSSLDAARELGIRDAQAMDRLLEPIARYYAGKLRLHGATALGVDWNSSELHVGGRPSPPRWLHRVRCVSRDDDGGRHPRVPRQLSLHEPFRSSRRGRLHRGERNLQRAS